MARKKRKRSHCKSPRGKSANAGRHANGRFKKGHCALRRKHARRRRSRK